MNYRNTRRTAYRPNKTRRYAGRAPKSFDPREMIEKMDVAEPDPTDDYKNTYTFKDFGLDSRLLHNILSKGYELPTPIQDQAIPEIKALHDVVGIANTGTGKTAAFLIPLINTMLNNPQHNVLIIAPTRELAVQIHDEFRSFTNNLRIGSGICIGGVSINSQIRTLQRKPQFIVGTPGRLLDLHTQRALTLYNFNTVVLDEVDRMLDMGFIHDITKIIEKLPRERQSLFFSATLSDDVKRVMGRFIHNPTIISVKTQETNLNVEQEIVVLQGRNKADVLIQILDEKTVEKTLIFMRTKRSADSLHRNLYNIGFNTAVLHGNKSQSQRQRSLDQFRKGEVNILIATDVASRGIDVDNITHVINYDLPESYEAYVHRIGRTGRADKKGKALTFVI